MMAKKTSTTSASREIRRSRRTASSQRRRRAHAVVQDASPAALVGALLREQRRLLNLTLQEVADRAGITKGFLSEIERDKAIPSVATLMRLRDALSLSISSLFRS